MKNKIEYLNFYLMVCLAKNIYDVEARTLENQLYYLDNEMSAKLNVVKNNLSKLLIKMGFSNFEDLEKCIFDNGESILQGILNGVYDYEWNIESARYTDLELIDNPKIKELYTFLLTVVGKNTIPLYYQLSKMLSFENERYERTFNSFYCEMLQEMTKNGLFNPNIHNPEDSDRPFWTSLDPKQTPIFSEVFLDERTNYFLLGNGSSMIQFMIEEYKKNSSNKINIANIDLIFSIIKNARLSVFDCQYFDRCYNREGPSVLQSLYYDFKNMDLDVKLLDIAKYLVSEQGIEQQLSISKYPSERRNGSIYLFNCLAELLLENPDCSKEKIKILQL